MRKTISGNVHRILSAIALRYDLDIELLKQYADADEIGGRDEGAAVMKGKWPIGSINSEEGKVMYALVRLLKPAVMHEFGTRFGCSATHIAQAIVDGGFNSVFVTADIKKDEYVGSLIPAHLKAYVSVVHADILKVLPMFVDNSQDILFEDSKHSYETTKIACDQAPRILKPGGFLVMHDIACVEEGSGPTIAEMQRGLNESPLADEMEIYMIEPSPLSIGLWRKDE